MGKMKKAVHHWTAKSRRRAVVKESNECSWVLEHVVASEQQDPKRH